MKRPLTETDPDGHSVALEISAQQLGSASGVVVGRNPSQAGVALDPTRQSRWELGINEETQTIALRSTG